MLVARGLPVLLAIAFVTSFAAAGPATRPADPDAELDLVVPDLRLGRISFGQAVDALRDRSGANIFVNWARLAQEGIKPDLQVELTLHDVTLGQAIVKLIEGIHTGDAPVAWGVRDGIITISTSPYLGPEPLITRFYLVRDILDAAVVPKAPAASQPGDKPASPETRQKMLEEIVIAAIPVDRRPRIRESDAKVEVWAGRLVATVTRDDHRIIRELLSQFREPH